jgi:hypothetical protein
VGPGGGNLLFIGGRIADPIYSPPAIIDDLAIGSSGPRGAADPDRRAWKVQHKGLVIIVSGVCETERMIGKTKRGPPVAGADGRAYRAPHDLFYEGHVPIRERGEPAFSRGRPDMPSLMATVPSSRSFEPGERYGKASGACGI